MCCKERPKAFQKAPQAADSSEQSTPEGWLCAWCYVQCMWLCLFQ